MALEYPLSCGELVFSCSCCCREFSLAGVCALFSGEATGAHGVGGGGGEGVCAPISPLPLKLAWFSMVVAPMGNG